MKINKLLITGLSSIFLIGTAAAKKDGDKDGPMKPRAPKRTFAKLDTDKDGKISQAEFTAPVKEGRKEKAAERFVRKDKDEDGFLSKREFRKGKPNKKGPKNPKKRSNRKKR